MKKRVKIALSMLLVIALVQGIVMVGAIDTPFVCPITGIKFRTEAAFVDYMKCTHDVDLQIEGELPEIEFQTVVYSDHVPVAYYVCPKTGNCFYTEPGLCYALSEG